MPLVRIEITQFKLRTGIGFKDCMKLKTSGLKEVKVKRTSLR